MTSITAHRTETYDRQRFPKFLGEQLDRGSCIVLKNGQTTVKVYHKCPKNPHLVASRADSLKEPCPDITIERTPIIFVKAYEYFHELHQYLFFMKKAVPCRCDFNQLARGKKLRLPLQENYTIGSPVRLHTLNQVAGWPKPEPRRYRIVTPPKESRWKKIRKFFR